MNKFLTLISLTISFALVFLLTVSLPEKIISSGAVPIYWFQIAVVASLSYLASVFAKQFRIPELVALIFVAIFLSPASGVGILNIDVGAFAWLAVIFKIFHSGLSLNLFLALKKLKPIALTGIFTFLFPFLITLGFGACVYNGFFTGIGLFKEDFYTPNFFFACALSFAVAPLALIDDILDAANIRRTPFGTLVISSQVLNELISWCVFALVADSFISHSGFKMGFLSQIMSLIGLVVVIGGCAICFGPRVSEFLEHRKISSIKLSAIAIISTIFFSSIFDKLFHGGIIFALLLGVFAGSVPYAGLQLKRVGTNFIKVICLPLFFYNAFSSVNIFQDFKLELFLTVSLLGIVPSYLGAFLAAKLSGQSKNDCHRVGIAASAVGISSLVMVDFLLETGAPGKSELLSAMALSVPFSAFAASIVLRNSFKALSKHSLRASLDKNGVNFLRPVYAGAPGFLIEEIIQERYEKFKNGASLNKNELVLLGSLFNSSSIREYDANKRYSFIQAPSAGIRNRILLEIFMVEDGKMDFRGEDLEIVFLLWYPSENIDLISDLNLTAPLMIEALENNNYSLLKKIITSKEEINPTEIVQNTLDDVDALVSEGLERV